MFRYPERQFLVFRTTVLPNFQAGIAIFLFTHPAILFLKEPQQTLHNDVTTQQHNPRERISQFFVTATIFHPSNFYATSAIQQVLPGTQYSTTGIALYILIIFEIPLQ